MTLLQAFHQTHRTKHIEYAQSKSANALTKSWSANLMNIQVLHDVVLKQFSTLAEAISE